ncbi:PREDICTED: uncharacterized protein LOC104601603 [Nelumbo nucifera]|uniref:Uncharacterized protein LOC104601603 n=1 Tax=Nelumbo nucifera TaxID=4432 RepID=A0A1U8A9D6_NELNU|nr:PREDICTED: uncharacterized protein LOC104601603 [Nelumbo nucifera]
MTNSMRTSKPPSLWISLHLIYHAWTIVSGFVCALMSYRIKVLEKIFKLLQMEVIHEAPFLILFMLLHARVSSLEIAQRSRPRREVDGEGGCNCSNTTEARTVSRTKARLPKGQSVGKETCCLVV